MDPAGHHVPPAGTPPEDAGLEPVGTYKGPHCKYQRQALNDQPGGTGATRDVCGGDLALGTADARAPLSGQGATAAAPQRELRC
jgi:hypothetical protein